MWTSKSRLALSPKVLPVPGSPTQTKPEAVCGGEKRRYESLFIAPSAICAISLPNAIGRSSDLFAVFTSSHLAEEAMTSFEAVRSVTTLTQLTEREFTAAGLYRTLTGFPFNPWQFSAAKRNLISFCGAKIQIFCEICKNYLQNWKIFCNFVCFCQI